MYLNDNIYIAYYYKLPTDFFFVQDILVIHFKRKYSKSAKFCQKCGFGLSILSEIGDLFEISLTIVRTLKYTHGTLIPGIQVKTF